MTNPLVAQRELNEGRSAIRVPARVVRVSGNDRVSWLDSLLTQEVGSLKPNDSVESLVLDGNGRIEFIFHVIVDGASFLLISAGGETDPATWLDSRVFMEDVTVSDETESWTVWGATKSLGSLSWSDPWPGVVSGGFDYGEKLPSGWKWFETLLPAGNEPGLPLAQEETLDALRVVAGRPGIAEVDERSLPHELGFIRTAVHLSKGCFPGQETVAKIHNIGHPPRRLVRLHLDGSDTVFVSAGDSVLAGDDVVGVVTTAGVHFEDGPVALAVIKRGVPTDADLKVSHEQHIINASAEVIVPPSTGATAAERLRPRGQ